MHCIKFYCSLPLILFLQAIEADNRGKVDECFTEMLKTWLQDEPQMKDLLQSLRGPVVDRADLANDLESKIEMGELEWK